MQSKLYLCKSLFSKNRFFERMHCSKVWLIAMKSVFVFVFLFISVLCSEDSVVTADRYLNHLKTHGKMAPDAKAPPTVIVCYSSTLEHLALTKGPYESSAPLSHLRVVKDGSIGILGGFGIGAPALAGQMERLIGLGTKRFVLVGLAGSLYEDLPIGTTVLCSHALKEDGLSHLYLEKGQFSEPTKALVEKWMTYAFKKKLFCHPATSWCFPCLFLETPSRIERAKSLGCSVVEMESAALFAVASARGVEAMALFVVSDHPSENGWVTALRSDETMVRVNALADQVFDFCAELDFTKF
jgi:uridine phosphorylase